MNQAHMIASLFDEMADMLPATGKDQYRSRAYHNAATVLRGLGSHMDTMDAVALNATPGLGKGTVEKIEEFCLTGKIEAIEAARASQPKKELRMPRELCVSIAQSLIDQMVSRFPGLRMEVCGSYRRKKVAVKDLDILATVPEGAVFSRQDVSDAFWSLLDWQETKYTHETVTQKGESQVRGYHQGLTMDLQIVPEASWGPAIVFWTGSADFNIKMRGFAKANGFALNRNQVTVRATGEALSTPTEESVFEVLGLEYVSPEDRETAQVHRKVVYV